MNDGHTVVGDRRPEDRAAARRISPASTARAARAVPADPRRRRALRIARRPRDGGLRRRGRIRHHRALGQEFPEDHPPAAGAARANSRMFGGVRFGGTLTIDERLRAGLRPHRAVRRRRAGRPSIPMKNGLARGVRQASDFLMALQLTGAAKTESLANLQLRLPVVVIGGGLTAIDTATESLAYYRCRWRSSCSATRPWSPNGAKRGARALDAPKRPRSPTSSSRMRAPSAHERAAAAREGRAPGLIELLERLGRRHHRLSPPPDRCAELHAQSRRSGQGDGRRHPLRRVPGAARRWKSTTAAMPPRCAFRSSSTSDRQDVAGRAVRCRRAPSWSPPGTQPNTVLAREDPAQRHARRPLFPGGRRGRPAGEAGARRQAERRSRC